MRALRRTQFMSWAVVAEDRFNCYTVVGFHPTRRAALAACRRNEFAAQVAAMFESYLGDGCELWHPHLRLRGRRFAATVAPGALPPATAQGPDRY